MSAEEASLLLLHSILFFHSNPKDPRINATHVITVASGPVIHRDQLESLVKDPEKDFFNIADDSAKRVVQRINELTQKDCNEG